MNLPKMSEHLTDSNILQSIKTYGRKKHRSLSISSESSGSYSLSASEYLKNNGIFQFRDVNKDLHSEESSDFVAKILENYNENSTIQKRTINDPKFSLYTEEDLLFIYSEKKDENSSITEVSKENSSITEINSSGSNYQRTRKNQKNRLSNQQNGVEEVSESKSCAFNIMPSTNITTSKSASNFSSPKQVPAKQYSHSSLESQLIHKKINGVKSKDACGSNLPQNPKPFKNAMFFSKRTMSENPSNNSKPVTLIDLVNRFAASSKKDTEKNNLSKKRKKTKEESESIPVKKFSKSTVIKNDIIATVSYLNTDKEDNKTSLKAAPQKNPKYVDNVERKSAPKKSNVKTPSKALQKKTCRSFNSSEKNLDSANNLNTPKKKYVKSPSKAVPKNNSRLPNNTEKSIVIRKKYVSKNKPVELLPSNDVEQQMEELPFEQSAEYIVQNQTYNNVPNINVGVNHLNMPLIIAPMPPISQEGTSQVTSLGIWRTVPFDTNFENLSLPGPSTLINDPSSTNDDLESGNDIYFIRNKTDATTIINESSFNCNELKDIFRPRTLINDGVEFQRDLVNGLKSIEDNCILHSKEQYSKIFLKNPALLDITVKDFCDHNEVTDFLLDYITCIDINKYLNVLNTNKGYDFPENFETENLLRLIKDFVHTSISYMVPANASTSLNISSQHILKCAIQKMSNKECAILMQVFGKKAKVFQLKDVLTRLTLVALFVIFDEYKKKKMRRVP